MTPIWFSLSLQLAAVAFIALSTAAWKGAAAGWMVACIGLLILLAVHLAQLVRLERWLQTPRRDDLPDAWGAWGTVFSRIYRMLREEERARSGLIQELELFTQAAEALPDGVLILDRGDQLLWCNRTALEHFDLQGTADYGLRVTNLVRVPRLAEFISRTDTKESFTYLPQHNRGQILSLETIPFGDGRKLLVSFDITQIERADTTRRDFIANVSHELRTPLTVIHGFLEHMREDPGVSSAATRRHIDLMAQQSDRMLKLVDDLLTLSRLEGGDHPPREEEIDMPALLNTLAEEGRGLSGGRHEIDAHAAIVPLAGSRDELRSALGNLVSNAIRYTPAGGRVTLDWRADEQNRGVFSVRDTGIGIAAEHIPRLTERFYRVDRSRSRETGGTGLGLAIVKHVLLRHQATLEIQSEPGKGSTFRVVFPPWRSVPATPTAMDKL